MCKKLSSTLLRYTVLHFYDLKSTIRYLTSSSNILLSDCLILYGWSSCGFKYRIWHQQKHSLSSFFILTNPFVEFRNCAGRGVYELPFLGSYITLFFSELASERNSPNRTIWLVARAGGFWRSCPLTRAESLAASFTSLLVVCEWAKLVIFNHFSFKTCAIISVS